MVFLLLIREALKQPLQLRLRRSLNGRTYVSYTICAICAGWSRATPSIQISVWLYHLRYLSHSLSSFAYNRGCAIFAYNRWFIPSLLSLHIRVGLYCRWGRCKISGGLRYLYHLLYKCLAACPVPFVAIFVGRCILCEVTLFSGGGRPRFRVPMGGIYKHPLTPLTQNPHRPLYLTPS